MLLTACCWNAVGQSAGPDIASDWHERSRGLNAAVGRQHRLGNSAWAMACEGEDATQEGAEAAGGGGEYTAAPSPAGATY
jgi:hypothetical protein